MISLQYGPTSTQIASKFDELTTEQFIYVAGLLRRNLTKDEVLIRVACKFSGIPLDDYAAMLNQPDGRLRQMDIEDLFQWIWDDYTMEKWMISKIQAGNKTLHGPGQKLTNVLGEEFPVIDYWFSRYNKTKDQKDLHMFIAALYRPEGGNPRLDIREELYDQELPERSLEIELVNTNEVYAIYLNYIGVRVLMEKRHLNLFSGGSGGSSTGWDSVFVNLARGGIGTLQEVAKLSMWNILGILENDIKQANNQPHGK